MRVLVTWGSKMGGTEGIAHIIGSELADQGHDVVQLPAALADPHGFDAVLVGGALYGNRWHADARHFVSRHLTELRRHPVWFFSSGPLDDSADRAPIPPVRQAAVLMERVGALGHATFGGRLASDAQSFPARAMAREHAGDWRSPERIRAWAGEVARWLPTARPVAPIEHAARSIPRLVVHGAVGWAACSVLMALLLEVVGTGTAVVLHAIAVPFIFGAVAYHYFRPRGSREPLATALAFTAMVAALDLIVVGGLVQGSFELAGSITGFWLPLAIIFLTVWAVGGIVSTLPWPRPTRTAPPTALPGPAGAR